MGRKSSPIYDDLLNCIKGRVMERLEGHTNLILGFNTFQPKEHQITLPLQLETNGKTVKVEENCLSKKKARVEENCEFPWDVLDIISKTLDFDDHFQFAGVCKNWRTFHKLYWKKKLASQEPLLQILFGDIGSFFFISIPNQKVYCSKMMKYFFHSVYVTSSSGYFIMAGHNNSLLLINPFTRIKKVIDTTFDYDPYYNHALLAFDKSFEEFVLVVLCNNRLLVYQSRNCGWVSYSTMSNQENVVDFVVLHNIIYVVTNKARIGVLSLNYANIKFLKMKSTPNRLYKIKLRLVNCDEQLLLVDAVNMEIMNMYKIDFSTMDYVKVETLGDIALFYTVSQHCYALSNPNMWGYESNSVYVISPLSPKCYVYSGDKKFRKYITLPTPMRLGTFMSDWCFTHAKYEVDYSLVE